jgi:hypothetical protein
MLAGVAALASGAAPSFAAYGDSANVFGKVTNKSGAPAGGPDSAPRAWAVEMRDAPPRRRRLGRCSGQPRRRLSGLTASPHHRGSDRRP